jgi:2-isopropylmalate synthase
MATRVRSDVLPFDSGIDSREIFATSQLLTTLTGEAVQANKAIVGRNAFAHEAGIHQDGMLKDRRTYEIMRPEEVGVPETTLVLGKHSGRHAVQRRCEQIGVTLSRHELDQVYRGVITLADREKIVNDGDLHQIVARVRESVSASETELTTTTTTAPDFSLTPAESGYGHGV